MWCAGALLRPWKLDDWPDQREATEGGVASQILQGDPRFSIARTECSVKMKVECSCHLCEMGKLALLSLKVTPITSVGLASSQLKQTAAAGVI